ncbi:MAG: FtsX-like permease family protein [Flavobacteriaceae bacterium]
MVKDDLKKSNTSKRWLFTMAWRDGKASGSRLGLFMGSIILGITAVVAIQSFSQNLQNNIALRSKVLMGADYLIDARQPPNERVMEIIDSLGGAEGMEVNFASMASFPKADASKLVRVQAIEGNYPIYGEFETVPPEAAQQYQGNNGALVDATSMIQYGLSPGDSIKVGRSTFEILGSLKSTPGGTSTSSTLAPPVILPYSAIGETGLLQTGSRQEYRYYFRAGEEMDLEMMYKKVDPILDAEEADLDTHTDISRRLGRGWGNFGKFLNLVAFVALLLGSVGIASSVHIYINEKLRSVAVLKCIGATSRQTFLIYLIQIAGMGMLGGVIGTVGGIMLQELFPLLISDFLPFELEISLVPQAIILGLLLGVTLSVLFAMLPLLNTWFVSSLQVLRVTDENPSRVRKTAVFVFLAILAFIFGFSLWLLGNWQYALAFVLAILVTFLILSGIAMLIMKGLKKYFPSSWGFIARQSLLNLFRPQNQTMVLVLAIGVGTFLISTLYFTKDMLLASTTFKQNSNSPNIILLDVQTEERQDVIAQIEPRGLNVIDNIPIVTMRVSSINDVPVNTMRLDSTTQMNKWVLYHEFRVTFRDSLIESETLVEGNFVGNYSGEGPIPISLAANVASDALIEVGDKIVFNVQGVLMDTEVASIREVNWARMQLNFSVLFPTGVLESAPQFHVITTNAPDEATSAALQKDLVKAFPTVSILDIRQLLGLVEDIISKISWVINFMAFFSILTGIVVLIGAVRTSKYQRMRESVLLRTIGAQASQILKITALEYLYLGILGSGVGILLSLISSQLLALFAFETSFTPSLEPFVLLPGITLLVLLIGLSNSRSILNSPPLEVLRKEVR